MKGDLFAFRKDSKLPSSLCDWKAVDGGRLGNIVGNFTSGNIDTGDERIGRDNLDGALGDYFAIDTVDSRNHRTSIDLQISYELSSVYLVYKEI